MQPQDLDGTYRITTVSDYNGPIEKKSDGITEVKDGKTHRIDDAGCVWTSQLNPLNEHEVEFISKADPTNAKADFCLTTANGQLTRDPVIYKTILKMDRKGDKIRLSGQIENGAMTTIITMMKIT